MFPTIDDEVKAAVLSRLNGAWREGVAALCALVAIPAFAAGIADPIPGAIPQGALSVDIVDVAQLPDTLFLGVDSNPGKTRINFFRELSNGRRFVNDLRGRLYEIDGNGASHIYANVSNAFTHDIYTGSLASGFTSFEFHPDYLSNGLFYTLHTETPAGNPVLPDTIDAGFTNVTFHTVLTEWHASNPGAATFSGTRRELLRVGTGAGSNIHPFGDLAFNPTASPGDADYGNLYLSGGDHAISTLNQFEKLQRLDTTAGTLLRINPQSPSVTGGPAGLGDYTVPTDNPFFEDANNDQVDDDPNTFGEIYAYGFRNAHRMAWDPTGRLIVTDIGESHIEEVNIVHAGGNYGWGEREGSFVNGQAVPGGNRSEVYALSADVIAGTTDDGFEYPVAQYDHDEGFAIAGGFVYQGQNVPQLTGKYVFGDIVNGRIFYSDLADMVAADDGLPLTTASIQELQLVADGQDTMLVDLVRQTVSSTRADLRFGLGADGEIYILTKTDGFLRKLVTVATGIAGDYNNSGQVEQGDLDLVLLNWGSDGATPPSGWLNDLPSGLIDQAELDGVLLNWGSTSEPGGTEVPEPAGVMGLLLLGRSAAGRRRGARR